MIFIEQNFRNFMQKLRNISGTYSKPADLLINPKVISQKKPALNFEGRWI